MKKYLISFVIFFNMIILGFSKDCPSRLFANLNQIGDSDFYAGLELRAFYYNYNDVNYYFGSLSLGFTYETDNTSIQFEGNLKEKKYTPCNEFPEISKFQIRRLSWEQYLSDNLSFNIGRQLMTIGKGLILDDFFDGMSVKLGDRNSLSIGAGIYSIYVARETMGCQKCFFYNYRPCWKNLHNTEYGDILMGFVNYDFRIKKNSFSITLLREQHKDNSMRSTFLSFYSRINLPLKLKLFSEFALQFYDYSKEFAYGANLTLQRGFNLNGIAKVLLKTDFLYGSENENVMFTPIFGSVYIGERQHFSVRQGSTYKFECKITPNFFKRVNLKLDYILNTLNYYFEPVSDELDLRFEINFDKHEKYKLITVYSIWSGVYNGSQISTNLRIVI